MLLMAMRHHIPVPCSSTCCVCRFRPDRHKLFFCQTRYLLSRWIPCLCSSCAFASRFVLSVPRLPPSSLQWRHWKDPSNLMSLWRSIKCLSSSFMHLGVVIVRYDITTPYSISIYLSIYLSPLHLLDSPSHTHTHRHTHIHTYIHTCT